MNIYAVTRKGKNKKESDDRIVMDDNILNDTARLFENDSPKIIGISDGVGGNAGGNLAAQFICEHAAHLLNNALLQSATKMNAELLQYAAKIKGNEKMAATFSAIVFEKEMKILHIGNTRIYTTQGNYLKQITNDHTTFNWLRFRGFYEEAEHCNKSELVSCFGGGTEKLFSPDVIDISDFNNIVMTSDGIHDYVDIDYMEEIICSEKSPQEKCNALMQAASHNGSVDDSSIVLIY